MQSDEIIQNNGTKNLINIHNAACYNNFFRRELWTGEHLQITVMSIPAGGEVGLELHDNLDQILVIEYGIASVFMGKTKQSVTFIGNGNRDYLITIPAGTWHNILNEQTVPLKLFSVYAPPKHPIGTIHKTKFDADLADE